MNRRQLALAVLAGSASAYTARLSFAQTTPADLVRQILSEMPQQLTTELSRVGVSSIARATVEYRRRVAPLVYDGSEDWRSEALKHLDDVQLILIQASPVEARNQLQADSSTLDALVDSFRRNVEAFAAFTNSMRNDPIHGGLLRATQTNVVLRSQLYTAAYFRLLSEQKYAAISKFTLIWPFC